MPHSLSFTQAVCPAPERDGCGSLFLPLKNAFHNSKFRVIFSNFLSSFCESQVFVNDSFLPGSRWRQHISDGNFGSLNWFVCDRHITTTHAHISVQQRWTTVLRFFTSECIKGRVSIFTYWPAGRLLIGRTNSKSFSKFQENNSKFWLITLKFWVMEGFFKNGRTLKKGCPGTRPWISGIMDGWTWWMDEQGDLLCLLHTQYSMPPELQSFEATSHISTIADTFSMFILDNFQISGCHGRWLWLGWLSGSSASQRVRVWSLAPPEQTRVRYWTSGFAWCIQQSVHVLDW